MMAQGEWTSVGRVATVNKALGWAAGVLLSTGGIMTGVEGLAWEATTFLTLGGFLGLWRFLRALQWSRRDIRLSLGAYVVFAWFIAPRAHGYYTTPEPAKTLTLACHYYSKKTQQPEVAPLKGDFLRHFFLGQFFPPTITDKFVNGEDYGCLLEVRFGKYGTALRQFTFTMFDNPELEMQPPLEPTQISRTRETKWGTLEQLDGHRISHSVTLYDVQEPPVFPIPRLKPKGKGKYEVRWQLQGTSIDVRRENVDLGVINGKFFLELD